MLVIRRILIQTIALGARSTHRIEARTTITRTTNIPTKSDSTSNTRPLLRLLVAITRLQFKRIRILILLL